MPVRCGRLHHYPNAVLIGQSFARSFATNSGSVGKGEIALFRAMQKSLLALAKPPAVVVEEYHGTHYQVTFTGSGTYSRTNARCELSDLLVIIYDRKTKDARITYIQAKSERDVAANPSGVAGAHLKANLEQWDLLARRPPIAAAPGAWGTPSTFNPPSDLLSGALLASIGAFTFFLQGTAGVDIYYCAASLLAMPYAYSTRSGTLTAVNDMCCCAPLPECLSAYGNAEFGAFLFGMMIGTPILIRGTPRTPAGAWLASQLRGLAAGAPDGSELARELADLLDPDRASAVETPNVGAKTLLLFGLTQDGRPE